MKKAFKYTFRGLCYFLELFLAFLVCYVLLFFSGNVVSVGELKTEGEVTIYIKTNGIHTDICLPVQTENFDWREMLPITDYPNAGGFEYVSIGWGDKGFFLDTPELSDLTFNTALNAAFLPSGTAMHVAYLSKAPKITDAVAQVFIDDLEHETLIKFIQKSFKQTQNKVEIIPNRGYWNHDNFYEAHGNYHLFNTCNAWTNSALKTIGVKTGWYALSADGIMSHLR
ncbi:MAG: TIGR02117 family protein [Crocinitomix sp.]|nr:TIGR02117 family protein [Crocinitomix sp.]